MASSAWSIRVGVDLDTSDIQSQLNQAANGVKLNLDTSGAEGGVDRLNSKFDLTYQMANKIYQMSKEAIGAMVDQVYTIDKALTEFKKVSDLRGNDLENYTKQLGESGRVVARTTSDMIDAATMFRKSGFSDQEAADLAQIASMYQNIADTEVTASAAAASIVSQIQAWGRGAMEPIHIIDAYNEVANNFAVGTNDLSQALEISAAGMATYNNSFEQTIGLVTAGTEIMVGRSSQVARGLNTIAANIVKNRDALEEYGIEVKDSNGNLKSTFDVLKELKPHWDSMTDAERNALGVTLAGKNQYRVLASIMQNFQHAVEATNTAMSSSGSAMRENAAYMESLEAKTTAVKAAFQELSMGVVDSNLVKGVLDLATGLLQIANTDIGHVIVQFTLLSGVLTGISGMIIKGLGLSASITSVLPYIALLVGAFVGLNAILDVIQDKLNKEFDAKIFDNVAESIEESEKKIADYTKAMEDAKKKLEELQKIPPSQRTPEIDEEIARLQTLIQTYDLLIQKEKEKLATEAASQLRGTRFGDGAVVGFGTPDRVGVMGSGINPYENNPILQGAAAETYNTTAEAAYAMAQAMQQVDDSFLEFMGTGPTVDQIISELAKRYINVSETTHGWDEELRNSTDTLQGYIDKINRTGGQIHNDEFLESTKKIIDANKDYYDSLKSLEAVDVTLTQQEKEFITTYEQLTHLYDRATVSADAFAKAKEAIKNTDTNLGDETASLSDYVNELLKIEGVDPSNIATLLSMLKESGDISLDYTKEELQGILDKLNEVDGSSAEVDVNADTSEMNEEVNEAVSELESQGITVKSSSDASALVDALGQIESKINALSNKPLTITVNSNMQKAMTDADNVKKKVNDIPRSKSVSVSVSVSGLSSLQSAASGIAGLYNKSVTVTITVQIRNAKTGQLMDSVPNYPTGSDYFAGGYALINDGSPVNGSRAELVVADGKAAIYNNGETTVANLPRGAKIYTAAETQEILKNTNALDGNQTISAFADGNVTVPSEINAQTIVYDASDYYRQNVRQISRTKEAFDAWQKEKKHQLELDLITQEQYYLDLEYMNENYLKHISDQQDEYWRYQEEIYKWKKSQLEDENELLKKQIELEKALQDVAKAKTQKILVYKDGKFQYMADIDAIAEAQRNVAQIQAKGYASGTLSADAGLHLVGENGPELRVLNSGDGIIPADATKNLLEIAKMGVNGLSDTFNKTMQTVYNFAIDNLSLPDVTNSGEFLEGLKNYAYQYTYANA